MCAYIHVYIYVYIYIYKVQEGNEKSHTQTERCQKGNTETITQNNKQHTTHTLFVTDPTCTPVVPIRQEERRKACVTK